MSNVAHGPLYESRVQLTLISFKKSKIKMARRVLEEDLKNIEFETSEDVDVTPTFDHMGLREDLLRGIYAYGLYYFIRRQNNLLVRYEEVNKFACLHFMFTG